MEVSGQFHASTALTLGEESLVAIRNEARRISYLIWSLWRREKYLALAWTEYRASIPQFFAIPTELSRLHVIFLLKTISDSDSSVPHVYYERGRKFKSTWHCKFHIDIPLIKADEFDFAHETKRRLQIKRRHTSYVFRLVRNHSTQHSRSYSVKSCGWLPVSSPEDCSLVCCRVM
jgi:hypothetical protein